MQFSDSDKIKIILETYKLDPKFFSRTIYPILKKSKSFVNIREELFEILRKEGATI